jgi:hypothetical protein
MLEEKINFIECFIAFILNKISIANFLILWSSKVNPDGSLRCTLKATGLRRQINQQHGAVEGHREWKFNILLLHLNSALSRRWLS